MLTSRCDVKLSSRGKSKVCKTAFCFSTVQQQCLRDLIRYSVADREDKRMSTEEHTQHSTKQQHCTEQKQLQKCELTLWRRNYFFLILAHPVYKR